MIKMIATTIKSSINEKPALFLTILISWQSQINSGLSCGQTTTFQAQGSKDDAKSSPANLIINQIFRTGTSAGKNWNFGIGGPGGVRTLDLMTASHARSQLRHRPKGKMLLLPRMTQKHKIPGTCL